MKAGLQEPPKGLLVIGYGNTLRRDDGVGPRVAEAVAALALPGVRTLACPLLTPQLAEPISKAGAVIFVDAAVDAPREVQLRKLAPADSSQIMAHAANPATLLALAREVFGYAPQAWLLTIPVEDIGIGEELSAFAHHGLAVAIEAIKDLSSAHSSADENLTITCSRRLLKSEVRSSNPKDIQGTKGGNAPDPSDFGAFARPIVQPLCFFRTSSFGLPSDFGFRTSDLSLARPVALSSRTPCDDPLTHARDNPRRRC